MTETGTAAQAELRRRDEIAKLKAADVYWKSALDDILERLGAPRRGSQISGADASATAGVTQPRQGVLEDDHTAQNERQGSCSRCRLSADEGGWCGVCGMDLMPNATHERFSRSAAERNELWQQDSQAAIAAYEQRCQVRVDVPLVRPDDLPAEAPDPTELTTSTVTEAVTSTCASCGANVPGGTYCEQCGSPLNAPSDVSGELEPTQPCPEAECPQCGHSANEGGWCGVCGLDLIPDAAHERFSRNAIERSELWQQDPTAAITAHEERLSTKVPAPSTLAEPLTGEARAVAPQSLRTAQRPPPQGNDAPGASVFAVANDLLRTAAQVTGRLSESGAFWQVFDTAPEDESNEAEIGRKTLGRRGARSELEQRMEKGFHGVLGFCCFEAKAPRLYVEAFNTRQDADCG